MTVDATSLAIFMSKRFRCSGDCTRRNVPDELTTDIGRRRRVNRWPSYNSGNLGGLLNPCFNDGIFGV